MKESKSWYVVMKIPEYFGDEWLQAGPYTKEKAESGAEKVKSIEGITEVRVERK